MSNSGFNKGLLLTEGDSKLLIEFDTQYHYSVMDQTLELAEGSLVNPRAGHTQGGVGEKSLHMRLQA